MRRARKERGVALLVSLGVMILMLGLCLGLYYIALADSRQATLNRGLVRATAYAEGAAEVGHKALINAVAHCVPAPTGGTTTIGGKQMTYTIASIGAKRTGVNADGLREIAQLYSVSATGEWNGIFKHVEEMVDVTDVPLFQFAIFYDEDLEIQPGPTLNIKGRVHTNANMYLGAGATLTLDTNYVRAGGHIYRMDKSTGLPTEGIVNILINGSAKTAKILSKKQFSAPSTSGFDSTFLGYDANGDGLYTGKSDAPPWSQGALDLWNGSVKAVEQGAKMIAAPSKDIITPYIEQESGNYTYDAFTNQYVKVAEGTGDYRKGSYFAEAGITVVDNKVYDSTGVEITTWPDVTGDGVADNPISESSLYDAREEKYVTVTNIDVGILGKSGHWPSNGLIYAMRTEASAAQPNGIRLKNGSVLTGPLSVASPDPVYVLGDYNTGKSAPEQPAAIFTDAFNVLSNAWDDTKTPGNLPHANPTTINCAILTGGPMSTIGDYNGGFENLPRFHEKWDGSPATINGSFVCVWDSEIAKGKWEYGGDRYVALSRDWNYDTLFDDPTKLPPFTPAVYYTRQVAWLSR